MNRYERYKDSGIPWLGEVPEHWEVKRLRFTVNLNPVKSELNIPEDTLVSFIPMEAVNFDKNLTLTEERNLDEVYKGYTYFKNGDVVLAKITPCFENGKSAIAQNLTNGIAFGTTELHVLRSQDSINNHFLYYLIKSDSFMKIGEAEMYGAGGQKRVPEEFIKNFLIGLPPYCEQTAITHYLDTKLGEIDALIDKQQTLLEKLAEQRTAVITHAVTKGLNPAAPMKNSGVEWLGDVPAHWEVNRLKFLITELRVGPFGSAIKISDYVQDGKPLYNQRTVLDNSFANNSIFLTDEKYKELNSFQTKSGDFLLTTRGTIGKVAIVPQNAEPGIIHPCLIRFRIDENLFQPKLLKSIFNETDFFKKQLDLQSNATTIDVIYSNSLKELFLTLPPKDEQATIADYLDQETAKIDRLCDTVNQTIGRLKEYRTALITQAVTGKIKVTDE